MSRLRTVIGAFRPPFLLLTPVTVLLGAAAALAAGARPDGWRFAWVLGGALAAHAAVNLFNEWFDFRSGLDLRTRRTPFSGGSGSLPADPAAAPAVLAAAIACTAICIAAGLWLLVQDPAIAPALLAAGGAGLLLVVAYTPWITRSPLACLLAPGLGFGPVMVLGTEIALGGRVSGAGVAASLPVLGLASGLLLLNQFPDVEADRSVGRRHLPMLWGRARSARVLVGLQAGAYVATLAAVAAGVLPPAALAVLVTLPLALATWRGALRHAEDVPALLPTLARNVALTLALPLVLAAALAVAAR